MGWDERLFDLLDDLEGQAEAMYAAERDAELADRSRAEYAAVTLAGRLMASVGRRRSCSTSTAPAGSPASCAGSGTGWCLVRSRRGLAGPPRRGRGGRRRLGPRRARGRLVAAGQAGPGAVLRRLADEARACVVPTRDGGRHEVVLPRVGRDFVEGVDDAGRGLLLPLATLGAVQSRDDVGAVRPGSPSPSG